MSPSEPLPQEFGIQIDFWVWAPIFYHMWRSRESHGVEKRRMKHLHKGADPPRDSSGVQWLGLWAPKAGGLSSIPGWGTRSHMPQPRVCMPQLRPGSVKLKKQTNIFPPSPCRIREKIGNFCQLSKSRLHSLPRLGQIPCPWILSLGFLIFFGWWRQFLLPLGNGLLAKTIPQTINTWLLSDFN